MIHPNMNVFIIDIESQKSKEITLDQLWSQYIEHSKMVNIDSLISRLDLSDMRIKISDWYGWTKLLAIEKYKVDGSKWLRLSAGVVNPIQQHIASVVLSEGTQVPSYNPFNPKKAFHGEMKYPFEMKVVETLDDEYVRILSLIPFESKYRCSCGKLNGCLNRNKICEDCKSIVIYHDENLNKDFWKIQSVEIISDEKDYGYRIYTKSNHFNVNKIYFKL